MPVPGNWVAKMVLRGKKYVEEDECFEIEVS